MGKERLIAFTDAILAIIMTILVLELEKPAHPTVAAFWALRTNFFSYFLSFFWLGTLWAALNRIWEKVDKISGAVVSWTLVLLFLSSFMPYATGLVSQYFYSRTIQAFYGLIVTLTTICNWILHKALERPNAGNEELLEMTTSYRKMLILDIIIKLAGLVIAIVAYPPAMMYCVLISAAYSITSHKRMAMQAEKRTS